jgi:hypothetical protein
MAIARFPSFVIDCPDAAALGAFYGTLLDWKVETSPGWADIRADNGNCISFQQVDPYTPPQWPGQQMPQQMHLLPGVPRPGRAPLLPLRELTQPAEVGPARRRGAYSRCGDARRAADAFIGAGRA